MPKIKKSILLAPKNIQLTIIATAAITFVMNTIHWFALLARVYPHGMRVSQFSVMAIGAIIMPALLFAIAYGLYGKNHARIDRIAHAVILTLAGLGIYHVMAAIQALIWRYQEMPTILSSMTWSPALWIIVGLVVFAGIVLLLESRDKQSARIRQLQMTVIACVGAAFVVDTLFNISSLILQGVGSKDIVNLLTHPTLIMYTVLPLAFFATAYLTIPKTTGRVPQLFVTVLYTLVGVMTVSIAYMLFNFALQTLSLDAYGFQTAFVSIVSLAVYAFLIMTHLKGKVKIVSKKKK